jgi:hypothetical protein
VGTVNWVVCCLTCTLMFVGSLGAMNKDKDGFSTKDLTEFINKNEEQAPKESIQSSQPKLDTGFDNLSQEQKANLSKQIQESSKKYYKDKIKSEKKKYKKKYKEKYKKIQTEKIKKLENNQQDKLKRIAKKNKKKVGKLEGQLCDLEGQLYDNNKTFGELEEKRQIATFVSECFLSVSDKVHSEHADKTPILDKTHIDPIACDYNKGASIAEGAALVLCAAVIAGFADDEWGGGFVRKMTNKLSHWLRSCFKKSESPAQKVSASAS